MRFPRGQHSSPPWFCLLTVLFCAGLVFASCDSSGGSVDPDMRYYEFVHTSTSETYVAATSDPEVIQEVEAQLNKPMDERDKHINGTIAHGDGGHNEGYPWHFKTGEWALADVSVEVCDGTPSFVSENVDYFVEEVGRYCPWNSRVNREVDPSMVLPD